MTTVDKEKAESVVSRSSKKKKNRKKRARQWSGYVENLKTTIDLMYEMCRSEQSVAGCREAMLYLQSASNDFKSLIETINVEKEWSESQETLKRPSVAWEVRKSMCSPNPVTIKDKPLLPISSIIVEAVKNTSPPTQKASELRTYATIAAVAAVAASGDSEGWKVVSNRRRKSTSSTTVSEFDREISVEKEKELEHEPLSVYERLSSTSYQKRSPNRTLTCPRSAMDLPQTRASMAKMAYSRQLLWEKNQQVLVEKLRAKQKKEKNSAAGGTRSFSQCGFTFADPQAVRKSVEAFHERKSGLRSVKETTSGSQSSNVELHSINETGEERSEHSEEVVPADPTPSSSISQPPPNPSLFGYVPVPEELEKDAEWRTMTEEEESLALEENSLHLEIKEAESMEIDAELERQVEAEAASLEREHRAKKMEKKREKQEKKEEKIENFYKVFEEIRNLAWSELMEQESVAQFSAQNVHEPGTPVEKHEKMSSPSRRRFQKDEQDFGKKHEQKQRNAEILRQQLHDAKAAKLKELTNRVEEVRAKQEALKERKRRHLEERMRRAAENRDKNIMEVIRKAKDDDQRVAEVKFIATLQEDNKRYDLMAKDAEMEEKQKQMADERARKHEEKAARKREQEAAATARRAQAAEARQTRIRQLSEQKEQKQKGKGQKAEATASTLTPACSDAPDMLAYLHSLCDEPPESPSTSEAPPLWLWPSAGPKPARKCSLCPDTVVFSDLEAASHLICSKEHQDQAKTLTSGSILEELKRHFYAVFNTLESSEENEGNDQEAVKNQMEKGEMEARNALEQIQMTESLPAPVSSPRNRTKHIREFNLAIEKMQKCHGQQIDEKTQESVEKSLSELLGAVELEQKQHESGGVNLEQFCAVNGPQKMVDALLEWTARGASLRLCIRISHAFCTFLRDPHVALSVLFRPELPRILDRICRLLLADDVISPQLSALLDVLTATLRTAAAPKKQKKSPKCDDNSIDSVFTACESILRVSVSPADLRKALEASRGSALCCRLFGLAEQLATRGNSRLLADYTDSILKFVYETRRCAKKASEDLAATILKTVFQNPLISTEKRPENLLILVILLEDSLRRNAINLRKTGYLKNRPWGFLSKDEETLIRLSEYAEQLARRMEPTQKRSLLISWTSGSSSCLETLKNVPVRLLAIGKHADRLVPAVRRILDRLTNSEKSESLGDISADLFAENFIFPGRKLMKN
ncbi:unnamed protein product [Caenorhabditis sp. 36 PRJEB53466]|nr:unnamed protein product [Caenorhabditis sp. 36 PRJEB53466]